MLVADSLHFPDDDPQVLGGSIRLVAKPAAFPWIRAVLWSVRSWQWFYLHGWLTDFPERLALRITR